MKTTLSILALSTLLISPNLFAMGGDRIGGGGGGVCIQNQCKTLAELGIRINDVTSSYWSLSSDVIAEIEKLSETLPFKTYVLNEMTIGGLETFVKVPKMNRRSYKDLRAKYIEILNKLGFQHLTDNFEIHAFSDKNKTYLLPSFLKLTAMEKANILAREGVVRNSERNQELAISFSCEFQDYRERETLPGYNPLKFYRLWAQVTGDPDTLTKSVVEYIEDKLGRRLVAEDISGGDMVYDGPMKKRGLNYMANAASIREWEEIFGEAYISGPRAFNESVTTQGHLEEAEKLCSKINNSVRVDIPHSPSRLYFISCMELKKGKVYGVAIYLTNLFGGKK